MANRIKYNSETYQQAGNDFSHVISTLNSIQSGIAAINTSEEWWQKVSIRGTCARDALNTERNRLKSNIGATKKTKVSIGKAKSLLAEAERNIVRSSEKISEGRSVDYKAVSGTEVPNASTEGSKVSWKDAIDRLKDGISAGIGAISRNLSDCKAYWVDNWNNKGWVYKTVKATGAVLNIVGSAALAISAIGTAVASGGAATPVAIMTSIYSGNSILNSCADLYNLFGGDISKVGEVNYLKDGLKFVGGKTGEFVGYKDAGEKVGEIIYTAGSVTTTVMNLRGIVGKVKQTDSLELGKSVKSAGSAIKSAWNQNAAATFEEAKIGAKGLWDIATRTPLNEVGLQFNLLKGHLSTLESTVSGMELLSGLEQAEVVSEAVSTGKKIIDAGVDVVNIVNPSIQVPKSDEAIDKAIETFTGIQKENGFPIDDFKDANIYEGYKNIKDIFENVSNIKEELNFGK